MASFSQQVKSASKRSLTGHHNLLPAIKPVVTYDLIPRVPTYTLIAWTFGRGSVIWKIWPAVLLHTLFAAAIVTLSLKTEYSLHIPNVMLTVLGVVIGFVISYRAMSGYDRYWMGRTCWQDIIKNTRTMGRLIWYHVPPRLTPQTAEELASGVVKRPTQELIKVMAEKRMALDLIIGFAVAVKHHIRGELGIYYEDLYDFVRPLHDHDHTTSQRRKHDAISSALPPPRSPRQAHRIASQPRLPHAQSSSSSSQKKSSHYADPPLNVYGTFDPSHTASTTSLRHALKRSPSSDSASSQHQALLPAAQPESHNVMDHVDGSLVPFAGLFSSIRNLFRRKEKPILVEHTGPPLRKWSGPIYAATINEKHLPKASDMGENLPVEVLRCLSEWCSVLEERNTVPGTSLGSILGTIAAFEDCVSALEKILTTPLPFVYSVHIRHTVWIYLFFLPFQLVEEFEWYTIPGVTIAAFIYLGFLAAGEEIEQPFGYDANDLDLDVFCQEIIRPDIESLKISPCLNAYLGPPPREPIRQRSMTLIEATEHDQQRSDSDSDDDVFRVS